MPAACDNCRFLRGRNTAAQIPEGYCHRLPPAMLPTGFATHRPVALVGWCGEHRWSLAGIVRALFRLT